MMGRRELSMEGDEFDCFTNWRHVVHWQRNEKKKLKRKFNKRIRKHVKGQCQTRTINNE